MSEDALSLAKAMHAELARRSREESEIHTTLATEIPKVYERVASLMGEVSKLLPFVALGTPMPNAVHQLLVDSETLVTIRYQRDRITTHRDLPGGRMGDSTYYLELSRENVWVWGAKGMPTTIRDLADHIVKAFLRDAAKSRPGTSASIPPAADKQTAMKVVRARCRRRRARSRPSWWPFLAGFSGLRGLVGDLENPGELEGGSQFVVEP